MLESSDTDSILQRHQNKQAGSVFQMVGLLRDFPSFQPLCLGFWNEKAELRLSNYSFFSKDADPPLVVNGPETSLDSDHPPGHFS